MVDFPRIQGTPPADIWGYAARTITALTGQPRTDLLGEDADFEAGSGTRKARIDATISSRSTLAQSDILSDATPFAGGNMDAAISSRASHDAASIWAVATRELTGITGTPRTDLIGENASFETATGRPALLDAIPAFEAPVEGSLLMDGSEQILIEKTEDVAALIEGLVNLTPMQAGDTVVIRESMQVLSTGGYAQYAEETYTGVQSLPGCQILTRIGTHDVKVSIQQTVGTYRTFEYSFVRRRAA